MNIALIQRNFNEQVQHLRDVCFDITGVTFEDAKKGFGSNRVAFRFADYAFNHGGSDHHIDVAFGFPTGFTSDYLRLNEYDYQGAVARDRERIAREVVVNIGSKSSTPDTLKALASAGFAITGPSSYRTDDALGYKTGTISKWYSQYHDKLDEGRKFH